MNQSLFKPSPVWDKINNNLLQGVSNTDYNTFREVNKKRANSKITTWNPYEPSTRYFKSFLNHIVYQSDDEFRKIYKCFSNTNLGNPINIKYDNLLFNLDYILSTYEILFLNQFKYETICEIGAGFGRTSHALLEYYPNIERYTIIDLPNCLSLTKGYLKKVLSKKLYDKIEFICADDFDLNSFPNTELFINIDSFAEMNKTTIQNYIKLIEKHGKYFYSKNTIGKYNPLDMDLKNINKDDFSSIMETGLCLEEIKAFDNNNLLSHLENYINKYKPQNFSVVKSQLSPPFYYYGDVLYKIKP